MHFDDISRRLFRGRMMAETPATAMAHWPHAPMRFDGGLLRVYRSTTVVYHHGLAWTSHDAINEVFTVRCL